MTTRPTLQLALVDAATALDLSLSDQQVDTLLAYLGLLQRWNTVYNLTAVRDPAAMLTQHVADCLAVIAPLCREIGDRRVALLDVGSGGGLPAVIIAAVLPGVAVTSVDAVGKKAAFVRQVAAELRLPNLTAVHARVEALARSRFEIITARAFASLVALVELTQPLLAPDGKWMAMKGRRPDHEIDQLPATVEVFHVKQLSVPGLAAERCLVWMQRRKEGSPLASL